MRHIKSTLAVAAAMATLLAMTAAPAAAADDDWEDWEDRDHRVGWNHGGDWEDDWVVEVDLDDCFWWNGELLCEVDF